MGGQAMAVVQHRIRRRGHLLTIGSVWLALATASTLAWAQAPHGGPTPAEMWLARGHRVPTTMDWWGPSYCGGDCGGCCTHRRCPGLLTSVGHAVLKTLDCLIPCHRCGAVDDCTCRAPRAHTCRVEPSCGPTRGCAVRPRRCCPPLVPSVRFHKGCCAPVEVGCDSGPIIYEGQPDLVIPPKPQPETTVPAKPAKPASARVRRKAPSSRRATRVRPAQRVAAKPVMAKKKSTTRNVSYETTVPATKNRQNRERDIPVNPLRAKR